MQAALAQKTEIKLYILYVMKNIAYPIDFNSLNDAVTSDGLVNYFNFADCFTELLETELVAENNEGYILTDRGLNVCDSLIENLAPGIQRTAVAAATRYISFEKRGVKIDCRTAEKTDGRYLFEYKVTQKDDDIFSVSLMLESKEELRRIEHNMKNNTDNIYKGIRAILAGETDYLYKN